jgi:hypothetical protein
LEDIVLSRTLILTHADLDGMVSGILLLTKLGPGARVKITNGSKLAEAIRSEMANDECPGSVYIADIPLDRAYIEEAYSAMEMLAQKGCSVHLYDHHIGWNEPANALRFRPLFATYDVDEEKTTAAALVWRDFLNRDLSCQRWLELLSRKDNSPDDKVADDFRVLAALMQPRYNRRRYDVMRSLAAGTSIEDRQEIVDWYVAEYLVRERTLAENADIIETHSGRRIGWIDLREEEGFYANISKMIVERHSVDLVASVIRNGVMLGGASIDRGIDLTFLHGYHNLDGIAIEVVGHKSPVRIRPVDGVVSSKFVAVARDMITEKI